MSVKRWAYLVFLVLASGGFVVDRVLLGEPESAVAEPVAGGDSGPGDRPVAPRRPAPPRRPEQVAALDSSLDWLEGLSATSIARDLFAAPATLGLGGGPGLMGGADAGLTPAEEFASRHQLQATYMDEEQRLAVVDGRILRVGMVFDGFRLVRVGSRDAQFERQDERVMLVIPAPLELGAAGSP